MEPVTVTDLYEAAYLILSGCRLEGVRCIPVSESLSCRLAFSGSGVESAERIFQTRQAMVNLEDFRRAYGQVNGYVHQAKKAFDRERREDRRRALEGGGL